ncbi:MAG TPA: hypothetical protein VHO69_11915 [Phototrophicaceae bacterium]|nr:hypothetical protein [Phototrophicaceae bacterium]
MLLFRVFILLFVGLLMFRPAHDQEPVTVIGSGATGTITPGETVTGEIEFSARGSRLAPITFVGHNGSNRYQGDFDAWTFAAVPGENYLITVTATGGDLIPTLMLTAEAPIPTLAALDLNADGNSQAGMCLRAAFYERYAILVERQAGMAQTGSYQLTLTTAAETDLTGGSPTAVCSVGTFITTRANTRVNIRAGNGLNFAIVGQMEPHAFYSLFGGNAGESGWRHILFFDDNDQLWDGYVSARLTTITGEIAP